jgi:hypothetical protein
VIGCDRSSPLQAGGRHDERRVPAGAAEADDCDGQRSSSRGRARPCPRLRSADRRYFGKAGDRLCQGRIFRRFRRQLLFDPLVGTAKARELYFTGRPFEADEALSLGLVNRVVPDEELAAVTVELARSLAHGPSIALSLMKRNLNFAESGGLAELLGLPRD